MGREEELRAELERAEANLARLAKERKEAERKQAFLREQLAGLERGADRLAAESYDRVLIPDTDEGKIDLFMSLFRGRHDVYPKLWISKRTGKKGYSPACANEWRAGLCDKRKVKCGQCPNMAFLPMDENVARAHLEGKHVVGVYPMLEGNACWFLAMDFDKKTWADDVHAIWETCKGLGLDAAVERSRSGNGAHVWFFFASTVSASSARKMGSYIITETMSRYHRLGMESYDRLFPNQDFIPKGGFGNLIALPLQRVPARRGNTLFVDDSLEPYSDQWEYLASIKRIDVVDVESIASEASRRGRIIGLRLPQPFDEDDRKPWQRPPSGAPKHSPLSCSLPSKVQAVLANRLFVAKEGVPSPLLNQIKRIAAFQNPEFYARQKARLSTARTARVICCSEEKSRHIALPRGSVRDLEALLSFHGIELVLEDERYDGVAERFEFEGTLTQLQVRTVRAFGKHDIGVFVAPPGIGKTVVGIHLIASRRRNTLVLVHRKPIMEQWINQLSMFLGISPREIGRIGGGRRKATGHLDVATIQSLFRKDRVDDLVADYGHVIVDECHHVPAFSFERVMQEVKARYVTGLTATPARRDGLQQIMYMQCGPVRSLVDPRNELAGRPFQQRLIVRETAFSADELGPDPKIQAIYSALSIDDARNRIIVSDVLGAIRQGRSPILLTERRDHLEILASMIGDSVDHLVVLHGGLRVKQRKDAVKQLASVPPEEPRLLLATGRYIGEGFDDARLDSLFLAMPIAWKGTLIQYTGRLHRLYPGKDEIQIYDYVDRRVPMLARMFEKRIRGYRSIGYVTID